MQEIVICVGSACHVKGSHKVIDRLQELIAERGLEEAVELKASFCMDNCRGNIGAIFNGEPVYDLTKENVDEVFEREMFGTVQE